MSDDWDGWIEKELKQRAREKEEEARQRMYLMRQRTTRMGYFATAFGFALAVAAVVGFLVFAGQKHAERKHEERIACNEAGGTFVTHGTNADQLCLVGVEQR